MSFCGCQCGEVRLASNEAEMEVVEPFINTNYIKALLLPYRWTPLTIYDYQNWL